MKMIHIIFTQKYTVAYGSYLTSFLRIYIDTDQDLGKLDSNKLGVHEKGIFAHEYTHFLQNITSSFGQMHVWSTYDRLRQNIAHIIKNGERELKLPLSGAIAEEQRNLLIIRKRMQGDDRVNQFMDDSTTKVLGHHFVKDDLYGQLYPDRPDLTHLELDLKDKKGFPMKYIFGETAVSETMAYLMELKHYKGPAAPEYPYRSCQHLGEYMGTKLLENDELLFALCDVSLLSGFPGRTFFLILEDLILNKVEPKSAEEMFDYGINYMYMNSWQVFEEYEKNMQGAVYVLKQLLPLPDMEPTVEWVNYLLQVGFKIRTETPHLIINLFREPILFQGYWNNIMLQFGNPSLHSKSPNRYFKAPYDLAGIENNIEPIHLLAVQEVLLTLIQKKKTNCSLYKYCEKNTNGLKVDDRCTNAPWERSQDEMTCAYGALWALYGLKDKVVEHEA
jgi:hypothetical protein